MRFLLAAILAAALAGCSVDGRWVSVYAGTPDYLLGIEAGGWILGAGKAGKSKVQPGPILWTPDPPPGAVK